MTSSSIKRQQRSRGLRAAYEGWPVIDLKRRAKELGMSGYSGLSKDKLIDRLRTH
jgi:hypothetical protein